MASTTHEMGSGLLFILVGPGGVGKNTLMEAVLPRFDRLGQLATITTRAIRPNEQPGVQHVFVTPKAFEQMIADGELVEYEEVHPGKYYGVPRRPLEAAFAAGDDLIADIEVSGAAKVRATYPENTVLIFIKPPSLSVLEERMRARGETPEGIAQRMERAAREMAYADQCDYVIVNDDGRSEEATHQLHAAIAAERACRTAQASPEAALSPVC
jgi:guanylate kinase